MKTLLGISTGTACALAACCAMAQLVVLDDSLSPQDTYAVGLRWEPAILNRALTELLSGAPAGSVPQIGRIPGVEVRLDTRDFVGEPVRIFLALPAVITGLGSPAELELRWEASGPILAGAVHPGQSALVFDGRIEQPVTSVVFDFTIIMENSENAETFELEPVYELEVAR